MNRNTMTKLLVVGSMLLLPACGQRGFDAGTEASLNPGTNINDGVGVTPPVQDLDLKGFIAGGAFSNKQVLGIDPVKGELLLSIPLDLSISVNLVDTPIPELPGAHVYSATDAQGNKSIVLAIPLKNVLRGVTSRPADTLPNGDPLPIMVGGEPPRWAATVDTNNPKVPKIHIYAGFDSVAVFVETEFNPYVGLGLDILTKAKQKVGNFALVPKKDPFNGGFFVGVKMPPEIARLLDKLIK